MTGNIIFSKCFDDGKIVSTWDTSEISNIPAFLALTSYQQITLFYKKNLYKEEKIGYRYLNLYIETEFQDKPRKDPYSY